MVLLKMYSKCLNGKIAIVRQAIVRHLSSSDNYIPNSPTAIFICLKQRPSKYVSNYLTVWQLGFFEQFLLVGLLGCQDYLVASVSTVDSLKLSYL